MAPKAEVKEVSLAGSEAAALPQAKPREYTIVYPAVLVFAYWHLAALYGLYLALTVAKWQTVVFNSCYYVLAGWGVTAGAHRLWSHRAYRATLPLQVLLMLMQTLACQTSVTNWVKDHRLHHQYTDTEADPHNATRGLFYSHIGWLMVKRHPEVVRRGKALDMADILENPVLRFQKKYYIILVGLLAGLLPTVIPMYFWQESLNTAYHVHLLKLTIGSHVTFAINSVAHAFGTKPYDKSISPVQNVALSFCAFGEGYHNYHHVFPFDYRTSELGNQYINSATNLIDLFAWLGWAYGLKQASPDVIERTAGRTGDGTDLWGRVTVNGKNMSLDQ